MIAYVNFSLCNNILYISLQIYKYLLICVINLSLFVLKFIPSPNQNSYLSGISFHIHKLQ